MRIGPWFSRAPSRAFGVLPGTVPGASRATTRPPGGHAVPMRTIGHGLKTFYVKAYTDNLTGLAGDGRLQPPVVGLPGRRLIALSRGRPGAQPPRGSSIRCCSRPAGPLSQRHGDDAVPGAAPRSAARRRTVFGIVAFVASPVGRDIVLGRAGYRVLSHLRRSRAAPGSAQKLFEPRDARPRCLLFFAATVALPATQSLLLARSTDLPFGLSGRDALWGVSLAAGLLINFGALATIYRTVPNEPVRRGTAYGRAPPGRRSRSSRSTTASRSTSRTSRASAACEHRSCSS